MCGASMRSNRPCMCSEPALPCAGRPDLPPWHEIAPANTARKDWTMATLVKLSRLVLLILLAVTPLAATAEPSPNVRFGLPSPAKADSKDREDYLLERPQYSLSYNAKTHTPNWVCW